MAKPTLTYTATTANMPYPKTTVQDGGIIQISNVTLGGSTRIQKRYRKHKWTLNFERADRTVWETIRTAWDNATAANTFPTFSFTEVYPSASAVQVEVMLSEFTPFAPNPTKGDFSVVFTQAGTY